MYVHERTLHHMTIYHMTSYMYDVITQAIKNMLYVREVEVIHSLHGCLVHLLPVLEGPHPMSVTMPRKVGIYWECMTIQSHMNYGQSGGDKDRQTQHKFKISS